MNIVLAIAIAGVAGALAIVAVSAVRLRPSPEDPAATERWIIRHAPTRARPFLRHLDRRTLGGAVVAVGFLVALGAALFVAWVLDTVDDERGFARWDRSAAEWASRNVTDSWTAVFEVITDLGGTMYLASIAVVVGVVDFVRHRNPYVPAYLAAVAVGIVVVNNGVKLWVDRERPDIDQLVGWAGASFPSGHSAAAAACWAALALVLTRHRSRSTRIAGGSLAVVIAIAVAATRVLLGVHWLTDVIAGVIVGWAWFLVVSFAFGERLVPSRNEDDSTGTPEARGPEARTPEARTTEAHTPAMETHA